jgi:hypothetical protein
MDQNVNDDGPDALEAAISLLGSGAVCLDQNPQKHETLSGRGGMPQHKGGFFGRFTRKITMDEKAA